ncbi:MAG: hypothetical protein ABSA80_00340 [Terriglobales bacterium]|jgi:hypothetical protein
MTFLPQPPFGSNVVNATISTVNASWGSGNSSATLAQSPDFSISETATEEYLSVLNQENEGTEPPQK